MANQNKHSNLEVKKLSSNPIPLLKQHPTGGSAPHSIPPFSALFGQHFGSTPLATCEGQCRVHPLTRSFLIVDKLGNGESRVFLVPEFSGKKGVLEGGICTITTTSTSTTSPSNPISDAVITSSEGATTTQSPIETNTQCFSQCRVNKQGKEEDKENGEQEKGEEEDGDKGEQSNGNDYFREDSDEIDALMNSEDYEIEEGEDGEEEDGNDVEEEVTSAFTPLIEEECSASAPSMNGGATNLRKRKGGEREIESSSTKRFIASDFTEDNLNPDLNPNLNLHLSQGYESTRYMKMARNQKIQECVRMLRKIVPTRGGGGTGFDPTLVLDDVIDHVTMLQNEVASLLQAKTKP